ncbi:MAG: hypothetical protein H0W73_13420 [Bacteroidetes bacterium]|nr:hypothetical protein [Bacteroidota bacterium]
MFSGKGDGCGDLYFANNTEIIKYNNGWAKMAYYFTLPQNCSQFQLTFFVWNTSSANVYFDDIELKIKKK